MTTLHDCIASRGWNLVLYNCKLRKLTVSLGSTSKLINENVSYDYFQGPQTQVCFRHIMIRSNNIQILKKVHTASIMQWSQWPGPRPYIGPRQAACQCGITNFTISTDLLMCNCIPWFQQNTTIWPWEPQIVTATEWIISIRTVEPVLNQQNSWKILLWHIVPHACAKQ